MRNKLKQFWDWLGKQPPWRRRTLKGIMLAVYTLVIFFPRPDELWRQIPRWENPDSLITTNADFLPAVNQKIDAELKPDGTKKDELKAVEKFVYKQIRYGYDWDVWGNTDYWPTVEEVWAQKKEDCDGQAVLAACIIKSRGFGDVHIVGNLSHVWVTVGTNAVMNPQADTNFKKEGGKLKVKLPGAKTWLLTWAHINRFPAIRSLLLLVAVLFTALHPVWDSRRWWVSFGLGTTALLLLYDWGGKYLSDSATGASSGFWLGNALLLVAVILTLISDAKRKISLS